MANVEFGTGKTVLILTIVAACFAVLWPKIFYPMLAGTPVVKRTVDLSAGHMRQERPPHLRPDLQHPALRERGRAIPASHIVPKIVIEKETAPRPPIPGMRPPMGGAGHVVPAPKTGGTMGIVMPLYTIGIVIFFMYTIMKVFVRKTSGESEMGDFEPDPEFRRVVFADEARERSLIKEKTPPPLYKTPSDDTTRLGWKERDTRDLEIDHLRRRLEETEKAMERIVAQMVSMPGAMLQVKETTPEDVCTGEVALEQAKELKKEVIDDNSESNDKKEKKVSVQEKEENERLEDDVTNYTTATMSQDAEAEDTAADLSVLDIIDDQDDLQEEYDAIWGNIEKEDEGDVEE